jgi:hypothetical protein
MRLSSIAVLALSLLVSSVASASIVSVKLTTNALGLGSSDLNGGMTVDPDIAGKFITSPTTGQGSFLYVQRSGLAGSGTGLDPLLVTISAKTRLDTLTFPAGLPAINDYQAGILYITKESTGLPDGKDEGIGVRAFTVTTGSSAGSGMRTFSGGLAKIEGSKEISGGTGPAAYDPADPNGAPHVDEEVYFDFDPGSLPSAQSIVVTLSKFEMTDRLDLTVHLLGGSTLTYAFMGPPNPSLSNPGDAVWNLSFSGLPGLNIPDAVTSFAIRAIEDNPSNPSGTAEHFLVTGFVAQMIPAPGVLAGLLVGLFGVRGRRRRA